MKYITDELGGNGKMKLTFKDWVRIGVKSNWASRVVGYKGPESGSSEKTIELYRASNGSISVIEGEGASFKTLIKYSYTLDKKQTFDHPGNPPPVVEIISVTDELGQEVPVDYNLLLEVFDLVSDYEEMDIDSFERVAKSQYDVKNKAFNF